MKAVVAASNQEKALVGAFSVITNLRMELFEALLCIGWSVAMFQLTHAAALCTDPPGQLWLSNCQPIDLYARNIQTFTQYSNKKVPLQKKISECVSFM